MTLPRNRSSFRFFCFFFVVAGLVLVLRSTPGAAQAVAYPNVDEELSAARQMLQTPRVQDAMTYVDGSDEETIREWLQLCEAYGPSGPQSEMARSGHGDEIYRSRLLYRLFRIYGLEKVHIDDELNVIGIRPGIGDGPTVVLNAHHDNVSLWPKEQPIQAFVADGRVWCPAARDDLMGTTQLLTVLRALNAADIETEAPEPSSSCWATTLTISTGGTGTSSCSSTAVAVRESQRGAGPTSTSLAS